MEQWIGYGKSRLHFILPDNIQLAVLKPNYVSTAKDPDNEIVRAISEPMGVSLADIVSPGKKVCIIADDITRPTPTDRILRVLLPNLFALGVRRNDIYFVLALGSHRRMTKEEVVHKLGREYAESFPVYQSNFADPKELVNLGDSENNVPIIVYRKVMDSDIRIGIGNIVPHNTLGWSGGSKILFPGVTSEETVAQFHMRAMLPTNDLIFGNAENAIRRNIEKWTEKIGLHFIINTVLTGNGEIYRVVAGHHVLAHRQGVLYGQEVYGVSSPKNADLVIVNSHPSDCDFWQGTKGLNPSNLIVRDGGHVILVSPFYEGVGPHPEYPEILGRDDADQILARIVQEGTGIMQGMDPLAVAVGALVSRMRRRFNIHIYSDGVDDALIATAKLIRCRDLSHTIAQVTQGLQAPRIVIIHHGAEVVPICAK